MIDHLILPLFTASECKAIVRSMRESAATPATIYGTSASGTVDNSVRRTVRVDVSPHTVADASTRLIGAIPELVKHFDVALRTVEDPQFLRYRAGDYFVAHQDGNTPVIFDDTRHRRISVVMFLNRDDYEGGSLLFHGRYPDFDLREEAQVRSGDAVFFRSETTHEVTPVLSGERFTIVSWYR